MPGTVDLLTVVLNGIVYKVQPGTYDVQDQVYFSDGQRLGDPRYKDFVPETVKAWRSWHRGYGNLYDDDADSYYTADGVDAGLLGQMTLAPLAGTTAQATAAGATVGQVINQFIELSMRLFASGVNALFQWHPTASPNGWQAVGTFAGGADPIGQIAAFAVPSSTAGGLSPSVGGQYLYVPYGNGFAFVTGSAFPSINAIATRASHFLTIRDELWKTWYEPGDSLWRIAKSSDGQTYSTADVVGNGVATVNAMLNYDDQLFLLTTQGFLALDTTGKFTDLIPEITQYADPHIGRGSAAFHNIAYLPSELGLLQFIGSQVINPQTLQSMHSIGPDQRSWNKSSVRGHFRAVTPALNWMWATLNSDAGDGFVMRYRDYPDLAPGAGWHPVKTFAATTMGAIKVSNLLWGGSTSYPILWFSAGPIIYQMRLPRENDNPLTDSLVPYQTSGTLDLSIVDDQMPNLLKNWVKITADISAPSPASISFSATLGDTPTPTYYAIQTITGTTGIVDFNFSTQFALSYNIQLRATLDSGVASGPAFQTPVIRSIALHHRIRPTFRQRWVMDLLAEDYTLPEANLTANDKVAALKVSRRIGGPVLWTDLLDTTSLVTVEALNVHQINREPGQGNQWNAHIELQDYAVTEFYTETAYTEISFTSPP